MTGQTQRVLVVGATGAQGGSVARRLLHINHYSLSAPPWTVRALTRRPDGPAAAALAREGVEIAPGSLDDPSSLAAALADCDLAFGVTDYWEHGAHEAAQGRALVDAVAVSGVRHLVLSGLPCSRSLSGGAITVPHFESKAAVERHARKRLAGVTFVHPAFHYENLLGWFRPRRAPDGALVLAMPQGDTPLAAVSVEDVGAVVEAILSAPEAHRGRTVGVVGDDRPVADYARAMSRVLGRPVRYEPLDRDAFAGSGAPGARELALMFALNERFIPERAADLALTRRLHPAALPFPAWMALNQARFRDAVASGAGPVQDGSEAAKPRRARGATRGKTPPPAEQAAGPGASAWPQDRLTVEGRTARSRYG